MKRFFIRTSIITGSILLVWLIMAQSCLSFRISDTDARKRFRAKGLEVTINTLTVNHHRLHYLQTGRADLPTIIFIHGTPGSWNAFEQYLEDADLLQQFRMIAIDRPGFGYSDYGQPLNLAQQSAIISPLLQYIRNGRPVYLAGHSMGSPVAIKLAADNPGCIDALVLLAGSNDPSLESPEKWRPLFFKTPLNYFVPGAMRPSNEELWYLKKDLVNLKHDFTRITCPVYIVHGLKDNMVSPGNIAYDKKMLVHAAAIHELIFPDANHFIPWTRFTAIKKLLLELH